MGNVPRHHSGKHCKGSSANSDLQSVTATHGERLFRLVVGVLLGKIINGENEEAQKVWHNNISQSRVPPECVELRCESYGEDILPLRE